MGEHFLEAARFFDAGRHDLAERFLERDLEARPDDAHARPLMAMCRARRRQFREALREAQLDIDQGADMLMVKPALAYLDVIRAVRERVDAPLAAYQVSGEYSMIKAAALKGWIDEERVVLETLTAIKRAGADMILSYFARDISRRLS